MADPTVQSGGASRQTDGATTHTVLSPVYEHRDIRIAHGIEFHLDQMELADWVPATYLDRILPSYPNVEKVSATEYLNHRQRVRFTLQDTTDKAVFRSWLETPGLHVIYDGHARYGRGPCFGRGTTATQSEDWGEGIDRLTGGTFRMGYPFMGIEASEIAEHGYTADLMRESEGTPAREDCEPALRAYLGSLRARTLDEIPITFPVRGHQPGDRYWTYRKSGERHVIHRAGWENTVSTPSEWGSTNVQCRVFSHLGCDTFLHHWDLVRSIIAWQREGNERYAYWTRQLTDSLVLSRWLANLIVYDVENAFLPWEESLAYAVKRTNRNIRAAGKSYRVI